MNRAIAIPFRWSSLVVFLLSVYAPNAHSQSAATSINGVYNGTYTCAMGPRTLKLSLLTSGNGSLTGLFTFYLPPTSHDQAFSYSMSGTFDAASGKFKLEPVKWEVAPAESYSMVGMEGAFNPASGQVAGKITFGNCRGFDATRDRAASANVASVMSSQKSAAAAPPVTSPARHPNSAAPAASQTVTASAPRIASTVNTSSGSRLEGVSLKVCNAGKIAMDVFISQSGKVSSSHVETADCAVVAQSAGAMGPAYLGLAFVDARGQWGAARRQDLLPDFGFGVLTRANESVAVRHGNATVSLPMQLLFRPRSPSCSQINTYSARMHLPLNATAAQSAAAAREDANRAPAETVCDSPGYVLNAVAFPDSREITFNKFCDSCDKKTAARVTPAEQAKAQRQSATTNQMIGALGATGPLGAMLMGNVVKQANQAAQEEEHEREEERREQQPESYQRMSWNEINLALAKSHFEGRPQKMPQYLIFKGTVSRVDLSSPEASEHWVNIYFRESPEQVSTSKQTANGDFNICTSNAEILVDMFGPDFRSRMIGKVLEIQGEYQRYYCKGLKGSVRVNLARQVHVVTAGR